MAMVRDFRRSNGHLGRARGSVIPAAIKAAKAKLAAVRRDEQGNIAVAVVLLLVPLMLSVGMAVDSANMERRRENVQAAVNSAAMEIALNLNSGLDDAQLQALGDKFFQSNLQPDPANSNPNPGSFYYLGFTTDADGTQHLSAKADYAYSNLIPHNFSGADKGTTLHARTTISASIGEDACVLALNQTASRALQAGGNTNITMAGCVLASNSSATDALYVGGSGTISADCVQSSGGIVATAGLTTVCAQNRENAWRLPDPFADLVEPVPPVLYPNPSKSDTVVHPGRYSNLTLSGTKTLQPGLYYIEGSLTIKGSITGTGVTIFMADGGITVNGNASLSLSAPETGDYAGMLFWSARSNTSSNTFNGNGATDLNGFLYFYSGDVNYTGNNGTTSTCLRIVANTIEMSGSSLMKSDCTAELGGREAKVTGPLYYSQ